MLSAATATEVIDLVDSPVPLPVPLPVPAPKNLEECMVCLQEKKKIMFVHPTCNHDLCKKCYSRCTKCPLCRAPYNKPPKKMNTRDFGILLFNRDRAIMFAASSAMRHQQTLNALNVLQEQVTYQERLRGIAAFSVDADNNN